MGQRVIQMGYMYLESLNKINLEQMEMYECKQVVDLY